jgi:DNA-binding NarL/FixJ family response regulator
VLHATAHHVLLGSLEPVVALGLRRALLRNGVPAVIAPDSPAELAALTRRLQPYAVVLRLEAGASDPREACVRRSAPNAKVVRLARDEDALEVLDPGANEPRRIDEAVVRRLVSEVRHPSIAPPRSPACPTT